MLQIADGKAFNELLAKPGTVVVKFYTDWCPDCHRVAQAYRMYAEEHQSRAAFADVNAEVVVEAAQRFDIRGIPTLLVFQDGKLVERLNSRDCKTVKQMVDFLDGALRSEVRG